MCYRKEFFDAAGIDIENDIKTWADYITLFKNCVYDSDHDKRNDNYLKIDPYDLVTFSLQGDYGGWIEDDMPFQPQEQFLQTLNLVKDFKKLEDETGYSPFFKGHIDYSNLDFYALFFIGPGIFTQMRERLWNEFEGKFRLAHLPGHGQNAYAFNYMFFLGIPLPAEEGRKAVGWKIIKYFTTSPEAQLLLFQTANLYPVLTTVYDDPLMETEVDYFGGQVANELYKKVALNIPSKNISEYDDEASFAFRQAVDSILKGDELSPEDILERARRTVVSKMQGE